MDPSHRGEETPKKQVQDSGHRDLELGLTLLSKDSTRGSNSSELKVMESFEMIKNSSKSNQERSRMEDRSSGSSANDNQINEINDPRVFSCNYCQRKFYSSQALGGHQNAHKRERTLAKRGHYKIGVSSPSAFAFGHAATRFSSMASLPLHGSTNRSTLGIQAHSKIHKPVLRQTANHMASFCQLFRPNIHQKPTVGKIFPEIFRGEGITGGAFSGKSSVTVKFEDVGRLKSKHDDHQYNKIDLTLKL